MRLLAAVIAALVLVPAAQAATSTTAKTYTTTITRTVTGPAPLATAPGPYPKARLTKAQVLKIFLAVPKVKHWLERYPKHPQTDADYDSQGIWTTYVWSGKAGEIAQGQIQDSTGSVLYAYTGPQVAWGMARGSPGAFGGKEINSYSVWLGLSAIFVLGLLDWRRLLSLRTLDVLALWSFSISLWFFNRGHVFAAMPFVYPGLFWLLFRCIWVGKTDRPSRGRAVWPVWLLAALTVFVAGFRIGLDVRASNVIDVGYSGVIGADRIWNGQSPYGHFPVEDNLPACGPADGSGEIRDRVQTNGHCESANPEGDTYGPVAYWAYVPGYRIFGWSHKWDKLPAVKFTTILFDIIALLGIAFAGRRLGGNRLAATAAFAWVAWPFTQYANSSNTNDVIMPALLIWGFAFLTLNPVRGAFAALAGWTKFASLVVVPLWLGYPEARRRPTIRAAAVGFVIATAAAFSLLLFEPNPVHAAHVFFDRTVKFQIGRSSPFSLWDWRQYHAKGIPNLHAVQYLLEALLVLGSVALFWWPRRRSPLRLAAFTAALLIGFESVLTHWSYLYLPWFYPFVVLTLLAPVPGRPPDAPPAEPLPA